MDAAGRYATRLRSAQETSENVPIMPGKRALRTSQRGTGNVAKRALGDITNSTAPGGHVVPLQDKKTGHPQRLPLAPKQQQSEKYVSAQSISSAALRASERSRSAATLNSKRSARLETKKIPLSESFTNNELRRESSAATTIELNEKMAEINLRIPDIDEKDHCDPLACAEYVKEIYCNWKREESKHLPKKGYMSSQPDLSERMRSILVDWLVDVHQKFKLSADTLYLTINVVDRFLSTEQVVRQKLQLVGVTSMLIASKYHEIYAPETNDFVYISDKAYTREEILKMEAAVLNRLGFNVTTPSPYVFLARFLKAAQATKRTSSYATFCIELAQQEYKLVGLIPSKLAAAACHLAMLQCGTSNGWNETMEHYSGFEESQLIETVEILYKLIMSSTDNSRLTAVRRKFSQPKYHEVAQEALKPMSFFPSRGQLWCTMDKM